MAKTNRKNSFSKALIVVLSVLLILTGTGFGGNIESASASPGAAGAPTMDDLLLYKERIVAQLAATNSVTTLANQIQADGSWANIKYLRTNNSTAYVHVERIEGIAKSVATPGSPNYREQAIIDKMVLAINYWIDQDIVWPHWYNNRIRVPKSLANTLLVAGDLLPPETLERTKTYLLGKITEIESTNQMVGSNTAEVQMSRVRYALYMNELDRLVAALERIGEEVIVVNKLGPENDWRKRLWENYVKSRILPDTIEGIQVDYSILFHGPLIYSAGYGLGFIREITNLLYDTRGTNLFPQDGIADMVDHILEHYAYIVRGSTMDYSTAGRQISTTGNFVSSKNGADLYVVVDKLLEIDNIPRKAELTAISEIFSAARSDSVVLDMGQYKNVTAVASIEMDGQGLAQNVVDSNFDTRWAAPFDRVSGAGDYIITDLGEVKPIGAIAIAFHMGAARKTIIKIEVSEDNENWQPVFDGQTSGTTKDFETYVFAPLNARYVKITGYGNTVNEWTNISEIAIFDEVDVSNGENQGMRLEFIDAVDNLARYLIVQEAEVPTPLVTGNKYYWKADYAAHPKENFLLTVRTSSNRTIASEAVNSQNLKGDFLADGTTYIYRTGKEYEDIYGAWDWTKIPGTTTRTREFPLYMIENQLQHYDFPGSASDNAGGVSDGTNGAAAMELVREGLSAKKSWFMFDNEFVALGADIQNETDNSHITTLNQSLLNGNVATARTGEEPTVLNNGLHPDQSVRWVLHDNIGYLFNENTNVSIGNQAVTGDRSEIHYNGTYVKPVPNLSTKNIFSLWLDHGKDQTDTYEYTVIPGISRSGMAAYVNNNPIRIISNTGDLQAVEHTALNLAQAVFWTPGSVTLQNGTSITVDRQVLVQLKTEGAKNILSISSLNAKADTVNVQIADGINGSNTVQVQLPGGDYAGQSVILELDAAPGAGDAENQGVLTGPATVAPGGPLTLTYSLVNVTSAVYAQSLKVHYDPNVLQFNSAQFPADDSAFEDYTAEPGVLSFIQVKLGPDSGISGSQNVLQLEFQALPVQQSVTTAVYLSDISVSDHQGNRTELDSGPAYSVRITPAAAVDRTELEALIAEAQQAADTAVAHIELWGHYPQAAINALHSAILTAVNTANDSSATQADMDAAADALTAALQVFAAKRNTTAGIGDLGVFGYHYGITGANPKWADVWMYDFNDNKQLDIYDLATIAGMVLGQ